MRFGFSIPDLRLIQFSLLDPKRRENGAGARERSSDKRERVASRKGDESERSREHHRRAGLRRRRRSPGERLIPSPGTVINQQQSLCLVPESPFFSFSFYFPPISRFRKHFATLPPFLIT